MNVSRAGGISIFLAYLGAVVGAGFASGQEIVQFFVRYQAAGFLGTVVAGLAFAFLAAGLIWFSHTQGISDYRGLLNKIMGKRLGPIGDIGISLFLFLGICTMFSASGAVFEEHLYLPKELGILTVYLTVMLCLRQGISGLVMTYNILVPVKILLLLTVATCAALPGRGEVMRELALNIKSGGLPDYWLLAALLYVAYNFTLAIVVLTEYAWLMPRGEAITGAACGGLVLGLMAGIFELALVGHLPQVLNYQVPMLYIAGQVSRGAKFIYIIVLWLGILTTAVANAYGIAHRLSILTGLKYQTSLICLVSLALPLSLQAFSRLVAVVYPLFGLLGMFIVIALLVSLARRLGYNTANVITGWIIAVKEIADR